MAADVYKLLEIPVSGTTRPLFYWCDITSTDVCILSNIVKVDGIFLACWKDWIMSLSRYHLWVTPNSPDLVHLVKMINHTLLKYDWNRFYYELTACCAWSFSFARSSGLLFIPDKISFSVWWLIFIKSKMFLSPASTWSLILAMHKLFCL